MLAKLIGTCLFIASANSAFPAEQQIQFQQPGAVQQNPAAETATDFDDVSVAKRFNYFDLELLRELASNENVFVSPASIKATLGMVLEGAKGQSATEIAKTLRLPENQQYARDQLRQLLYDISDQNANTLLYSANGIFVSNKLQINPAYQKAVVEFYHNAIKTVNFANVDQSTSTINAWVSNATRGLIPSIVSPETIGTNSKIVIANAMYFKGIWKYEFDATLTSVRCFHLQSGQCMNSYMMQNSFELNYKLIGDIDAHALELPYSDDKYAMLILVPQVRNNINALIRDLQHANFNSIIDKLERTEVLFEIPKFEIESNIPLLKPLKQLGIREVFGDKANLSGIVFNEQVTINNIVHKTKIEVNEQGTIAAAATAAIVIPLMGSATPRVIANHPFLFFIYKRDNRNIIFEGIVNKPLEAFAQQQQPAQPKRAGGNFNYARPGIVANNPQFRKY